VHRSHVEPAQLRSEAVGFADGRAREHERGLGAVAGREPAQAAQQLRDVRAEDPAQHVELVDDDVPQPHEERRPPGMVGQDPVVQHLGVGEQHVGVAPNPCPLLGARVAVVAGGVQTGDVEVAEGAQLVVGQCLRGEEQQRGARSGACGHGLGDRRLVAERLPRGGARGDDHGVAGAHEIDGARLVRPEAVDADGLGDRRWERPGELAVARCPRRQVLEVDQIAQGRRPLALTLVAGALDDASDQLFDRRLDEGHGRARRIGSGTDASVEITPP
jgi:hypothetical protein